MDTHNKNNSVQNSVGPRSAIYKAGLPVQTGIRAGSAADDVVEALRTSLQSMVNALPASTEVASTTTSTTDVA